MKNILLRPFLLIFLMLLTVTSSYAQGTIEVKGVVSGESDGQPLIGATVLVAGKTGSGAITGVNGEYTITVDKGATLEFHYVGLESTTAKANKSVINVSLGGGLVVEEVVAIGFGTAIKKELTGAAARVNSEELEEVVSTDVSQALQGLVSGVSVTSSSGDPGATANVQIRGVTSLSGDNNPLYVVDGIPQDENPNLSSNEIQSMDVLKDAASCAVYGTRGAAGVILITTKQGQAGKMRYTFDASVGFQSIAYDRLPELCDAVEQTYVEYLNMRQDKTNDRYVRPSTKQQTSYYRNDTDVMGLILVEGAKPEQNYSFTMNGGQKELTYSMVLGYANTAGLVVNSGYQRYNMRTNVNYKRDKFKFNSSVSFMMTDTQSASSGSFGQALTLKPYSPAVGRDIDTYQIPGDTWSSEVGTVSGLIRSFNTTTETLGASTSVNLGADYSITDALTVSAKGSLSYYSTFYSKIVPNVSITNLDDEIVSDGAQSSSVTNNTLRRLSINWYAGLTYNKTFNKKHKVTGTLMASYSSSDSRGFQAAKTGVVSNDLAVLNAATYNPSASSQNYSTNYLFGTIARVQYSFYSRYILSVSCRADASSKFSEDNRWGYFPSVSAGWNISDEPFWKPLKNTVNSFKLRASFGTTGNQNFSSYLYQETLTLGADYSFGNEQSAKTGYGMTKTSYSNPSIKWETSKQQNYGFDLGFFKNKLTFATDIYSTTKEDMLSQVRLPTSTGTGAVMTQNIGNMINKGVEFTLGYKQQIKDFFYNVSVNYSKNVNEITYLGSSEIIYNDASKVNYSDANSAVTVFAPGYEAGAFFLYKTDGIANTPDKLKAYQKIDPDAELGDLIFVDANNDGAISISDRVYCGSGLADFEVGLNVALRFKGWDLSTRWFASVGNEILNGPLASSFSTGRNVLMVNQWSRQNPNSDIPRMVSKNYIAYSDLWLEDGSFFRMKTLTLGYTFPKKWLQAINVQNLRLFASGQNLFTLTNYTGMDPEIGGNGLTTRGIDKGGYPVSKKIVFGAKLQF